MNQRARLERSQINGIDWRVAHAGWPTLPLTLTNQEFLGAALSPQARVRVFDWIFSTDYDREPHSEGESARTVHTT